VSFVPLILGTAGKVHDLLLLHWQGGNAMGEDTESLYVPLFSGVRSTRRRRCPQQRVLRSSRSNGVLRHARPAGAPAAQAADERQAVHRRLAPSVRMMNMSRRQDVIPSAELSSAALDLLRQREPADGSDIFVFPRRLRILVCSQNHAPELIGIGKYTGELVAWLAAHGNEVRVVAAPPYYPAWRLDKGFRNFFDREPRSGAMVYRCPLWVPQRQGGRNRILHLLSFALSSLPVILWQGLTWRPDLVITVEPPLFTTPAAWLATRLAGAKGWLHVQDFEIDAAFELGLVKTGLMRRLATAVERFLLERFDRVSSISAKMLERLRAKGVADARIYFLPNWVDAEVIFPVPGPSPLRAELGIGRNTIVALYSGNMGAKQGLEMLARAAELLQHRQDILFVFAGDGSERAAFEAQVAGLANVRFLPLQPADRLNDLLNLADMHLLPQRRETADLVMPSKLTGMMASGRPVIAGADTGTQIATVVHSCGIVVPPENGDAMATAVAHLADRTEKRLALGEVALRLAIAEWSKETTLRSFAAELCGLVETAPAETPSAATARRRSRPPLAASGPKSQAF
jgi:colanic acid biosynthesis glycosyl transferase WcaI